MKNFLTVWLGVFFVPLGQSVIFGIFFPDNDPYGGFWMLLLGGVLSGLVTAFIFYVSLVVFKVKELPIIRLLACLVVVQVVSLSLVELLKMNNFVWLAFTLGISVLVSYFLSRQK